ncbi:LOW QUALITY PROTEIN: hypothetical protein ACHAWF_009939 [Thalassiosira exigua]
MEAYVRHASSLPPEGQLPTLAAIALILGLGKGGVPGLATVATAATVLTAPPSITGGLGYAVALMVPILTMIDVYAAWLHRVVLDWPSVRILLPASFAGMALGQMADRRLTDRGARLLVGTILLGILALRTWRDVISRLFPEWAIRNHVSGDSREHKREVEGKGSGDEAEEAEGDEQFLSEGPRADHDVEGGHGLGVPATAVPERTPPRGGSDRGECPPRVQARVDVRRGPRGGAATILTNSMGPILNVYLLSAAELSPRSYVGTRTEFFYFLNLGKVPMRIARGTLGSSMARPRGGAGVRGVVRGVLGATDHDVDGQGGVHEVGIGRRGVRGPEAVLRGADVKSVRRRL